MNRRRFVYSAALGLMVPFVRASIPVPVAFFKSAASSGCTLYPCTISGLQNWLIADTASLNDGDPVTTWTDAFGGIVASASGTARATYKTGIFGSQPIIRFDGTNDTYSLSPGKTFNITSGFTLQFMWGYSAAGAVNRWMLSKTTTPGFGGLRFDGNAAQLRFSDEFQFPASNIYGGNITPVAWVCTIRYTTRLKCMSTQCAYTK